MEINRTYFIQTSLNGINFPPKVVFTTLLHSCIIFGYTSVPRHNLSSIFCRLSSIAYNEHPVYRNTFGSANKHQIPGKLTRDFPPCFDGAANLLKVTSGRNGLEYKTCPSKFRAECDNPKKSFGI